jgi:Methyltransferase domain
MSAAFVRWLELREPADAAARSRELVEELRRHLPAARPLVIHDLGGGSGAMGRWLAPLLPQPQHWVIHDRDEDLLALAVADPPAGVTVEARRGDITRLAPEELAGVDLVVASALLDMLTADELRRMLGACSGHRILIAMTVTGRVSFAPPEPLDVPLGVAFNAHQRRDGRLGPDAVPAALDALGGEVLVRPSPWHLGADHAELMTAWFGGWVDAACEQDPALLADVAAYRDRRLTQAAAGELAVTVDHADVLVLP